MVDGMGLPGRVHVSTFERTLGNNVFWRVPVFVMTPGALAKVCHLICKLIHEDAQSMCELKRQSRSTREQHLKEKSTVGELVTDISQT